MVRGITEGDRAGRMADDRTGRVALRPVTAGDQDEFLALAQASTRLHHPWYSMPTTPEEFWAYLIRYAQPATEGFLVGLRDGGAMAGVVTIDSIIRGRFQSASLRYAAFAPAAGRGYMSEGLAQVPEYAFQELRLTGWRPTSSPETRPRRGWRSGSAASLKTAPTTAR